MTAINAFQDEHFAYLACDSAYVDYDGKIRMLGGKMFASNEYGFAVTLCGAGLLPRILTSLTGKMIADQQSAMKNLEVAFVQTRKDAVTEYPDREAAGLNEITMILACFLEREARPAIFRISTSDSTMPGYPVNRWHELDGYHNPGDYPQNTLANAWVDDPFVDGRALFRAQRNSVYRGIEGGNGMGGTCSLYRVGRLCVEGWDILEFADQVGERVNLAVKGVDVLREIQPVGAFA